MTLRAFWNIHDAGCNEHYLVHLLIFGEPDYYPKHGFVPCEKFGITTADGDVFDAFMAYPLKLSCQWLHEERLGRICEVQKNRYIIRKVTA